MFKIETTQKDIVWINPAQIVTVRKLGHSTKESIHIEIQMVTGICYETSLTQQQLVRQFGPTFWE
jgi:hypothetical protein